MLFINVNGKEAARKAHEVIRMLAKDFPGKLDSEIAEQKRNLRDWEGREAGLDYISGGRWVKEIRRKMVKDDGDAYTELIALPEDCKTDDDAVGFFRDWLLIECRPSQYDCTGQLFTAWYKVFKRGGRFMAYHRVCADV